MITPLRNGVLRRTKWYLSSPQELDIGECLATLGTEGGKMRIKGKKYVDAQAFHHGETRCIDVTKVLIVIASQNLPGPFLICRADADDLCGAGSQVLDVMDRSLPTKIMAKESRFIAPPSRGVAETRAARGRSKATSRGVPRVR